MTTQNEPRKAVFIKKGWFIFWCVVSPTNRLFIRRLCRWCGDIIL